MSKRGYSHNREGIMAQNIVGKKYPVAFNNQPMKAGGSGACP
jgi:hypothetical protein